MKTERSQKEARRGGGMSGCTAVEEENQETRGQGSLS